MQHLLAVDLIENRSNPREDLTTLCADMAMARARIEAALQELASRHGVKASCITRAMEIYVDDLLNAVVSDLKGQLIRDIEAQNRALALGMSGRSARAAQGVGSIALLRRTVAAVKVRDIVRSIFSSRWSLRGLEVIDAFSENHFAKRGMLAQAFAFAALNQVVGDYFEFGLWAGESFAMAHRMRRRHHFDRMMLFGFDSFEGLPEIDDYRNNVWSKGDYACSEAEVRRILRRAGLRDDSYVLIKGYYEKSLNDDMHKALGARQAAIVYIDCDLYSSAKLVLNFIERYLVEGSIVCFDDYYCYKGCPHQGEQRALGEFLRESKLKFRPWLTYYPVGQSFIVNTEAERTIV
jgi:hypothetical protein